MTEAAINRHAIQAMVGSQAAFAVSDTLVKLASSHLPPGEIIAVRGVFGTCFVSCVILLIGGAASLRLLANRVVLVRAVLESVISLLFVLSISHMPIANYTAVIQAAPLMITAMSVVIYSATVGWRRWLAVVAGFAGVLLAAKPETGGFGWPALYAIACAFLVAVRDIVTRNVPSAIPSHAVTLVTTLATTIMALGICLVQPVTLPTGFDLMGLAIAACAVTTGNFCVIMACRRADLSVVAPFRYSVMPFALLSGFLVWGNVPDWFGIAGIVLICASGLYAVHRERVRARLAMGGAT